MPVVRPFREEKYMVEGVEHWRNHVERCHGTLYAPCLPNRSCQG